MIRIFLGAVLLVVSACASTGKYGSEVRLPPTSEAKLKNGLPVLLIEDDTLPYISYLVLIRSGTSDDPAGQSGLSSLVAELLDQGTNKRNAIELADSLGQVGADFSIGASRDYTMAFVSGLSYHQDRLLTDFTEILTQPSFSQSEVNRIKAKRISQLRQIADEPDDLAEIAFDSYLFGKTHPYGQRSAGSVKDVRGLKRKNIIRHYLQVYRPNNAYMAVIGNFKKSEMLKKLESAFADWTPRETEDQPFGEAPKVEGLQIRLVDKGDLKQTQLRFGHMGIQRDNPDYLPLRLANTILGGAFASRLMQEVREEKGLTYSISSNFEAHAKPGAFMVSTFTRNDKVGETVKTTLEVLKEFREKGVSESEVEDAKNYMIGNFPRSLETPEALAANLLILRHYGISEGYLRHFVSNVAKISTSEVNGVIKKYIHPDQMKILVFSPRTSALRQLKDVGKVEVKSYRDFL